MKQKLSKWLFALPAACMIASVLSVMTVSAADAGSAVRDIFDEYGTTIRVAFHFTNPNNNNPS